MTDDVQQNEICIITAQLVRDMKTTASDKEIEEKIYFAMRVQKKMLQMYGKDYSKVYPAVEEVITVTPVE